MRRWIAAVITTTVLATAGTRAEEGKPGRGGPGGEHHRGEMRGMLLPPHALEDLQLTADQKTKYDAIEQQFSAEQSKWRDDHKADHEQLMKDMEAARAAKDDAKLQALREKMKEAYGPMMETRKKYMDQVRALLTADQQKKLDEMKERMRERAGAAGGAPRHHEGAEKK